MNKKTHPNKLLVFGSIAYDCIETPEDKADFVLGGSASYAGLAAAFYAPVELAGAVGNDFKQSDIDRLTKRGINLDNVLVYKDKPSFFWRGKYLADFTDRETLDVQLNCYADYKGVELNESARMSSYVLLGNISPDIQSFGLEQVNDPSFVILDTMDLWIRTANEKLKELISKVDMLILNESEARLLANTANIIRAGDAILEMGAKCALVKTGEFGAMLFHKDGFFAIPAYPVRDLRDPTGAGDSFAGALAGYIAKHDKSDFETLKRAMIIAAAAASLTVESFSCDKLESSGLDEIDRRAQFIKNTMKI